MEEAKTYLDFLEEDIMAALSNGMKRKTRVKGRDMMFDFYTDKINGEDYLLIKRIKIRVDAIPPEDLFYKNIFERDAYMSRKAPSKVINYFGD